MKLPSFLIAAAFTVSVATSAFAGGGACQFKSNGLPLLSQSPVLSDVLVSKFLVEDSGKMGPIDAPFEGRRLYTYMEFRAAAVRQPNQKFLIRLHFKGIKNELAFERLEILPIKDSSKEE